MKKILLDNLTFGYTKKELLFENVSIDITDGDRKGLVVALMGESGSGKTTLLKLFLALEKPISGTITLMPPDSTLSYVPQDPVLFDHLTPMESASYFKRTSNLKKHFNEEIFKKVSLSLDLDKVLNSKIKISELSGGEKQRISLLRALSIKPDILFLDEPCNGLDQEVKLSFLLKLRQITESLGLMVIYITHHYDEAKFIADQICYLVKDEKEGIVRNITKQSFEDFGNTPPSKAALALMSFPVTNVLKIEDLTLGFSLSDSPNCYLHLGIDNIVFSIKEEPNFFKVLQSDTYSIYKHKLTENFIALDKQIMNKENFNLQFKGTLLCYDEKGIYAGKKSSKYLK